MITENYKSRLKSAGRDVKWLQEVAKEHCKGSDSHTAYEAITIMAECGLNAGVGHCHFEEVPRTNPQEWCLRIDGAGYVKLARDNDMAVTVELIYKCDEFNLQYTSDGMQFSMSPNLDARKVDDHKWIAENLNGAIAYVKFIDKNVSISEHFSNTYITQVLNQGSRKRNGDKKAFHISSSKWAESFIRTKVRKAMLSKQAINPYASRAIQQDNTGLLENDSQPKLANLSDEKFAEVKSKWVKWLQKGGTQTIDKLAKKVEVGRGLIITEKQQDELKEAIK